jgi:hypothetical protein
MGVSNGLGPIGPLRSVDRPARCLFCGGIGVWWGCSCEWSVGIREGKLEKPRTEMGGGVPVIILCKELREAARGAGVIVREYGRGNAPKHGVEPRNDSPMVRESVESSVTPGEIVTPIVTMVCGECGKRFTPATPKMRYCSGACRVRAHRRR